MRIWTIDKKLNNRLVQNPNSKYSMEVNNEMSQENLNTSLFQTRIAEVILNLIAKHHWYKYICTYLFKEKFHLLS